MCKIVKLKKGGIVIKKFILIITLCLTFSLTCGVTGAYLNQKTNNEENVITIGKINANLSEPEWDKLTNEDKILTPGKIIAKDPTVTNLESSTNACYAFLQVTIPRKEVRLYEFLDDGTSVFSNNGEYLTTDLFEYELNDGWVQIESSQNNNESIYIYGFETPINPGESTNPLFNEIKYVNVIEGDVPIHTELVVPVVMITIQSDYLQGVSNVKDAWNVYQEVEK